MIDWFVVVVPLVLAMLCALLAFTGCTPATLDGPRGAVVASLHVSTLHPRPARVVFSWEIDGETADPVSVPEPLGRSLVVGDTQFLVFHHAIELEEAAEVIVSCLVFTAAADDLERLRGSATCEPIQFAPITWPHVTFVFDPDGEHQVTCAGVFA